MGLDTDKWGERIDAILWPHPFSGQPGKPNQVAISNGLPPDGKVFAMSYHMARTAILATLMIAVKEGYDKGYKCGVQDEIECVEKSGEHSGLIARRSNED